MDSSLINSSNPVMCHITETMGELMLETASVMVLTDKLPLMYNREKTIAMHEKKLDKKLLFNTGFEYQNRYEHL